MTINIADFAQNGVVNLPAFNAALAIAKSAYIPSGVFEIDPDIGIVLPNGFHLTGEGESSILKASPKGATLAQLGAYTKGSVIKRNPPVAGQYVSYGYAADFVIQLNHPAVFSTGNYRQIAMDLRNISRSVFERVITVNGDLYSNIDANKLQGYGWVLGTCDTQYCGGVGNVIKNCRSYAHYKAYAQDDLTLCNGSGGAHGTIVEGFDGQWAQHIFYVAETATGVAGCSYSNLMLQVEAKQPLSAEPSYSLYFGGFDSRLHVAYQEYNDDATTIVLSAGSRNNILETDHPSNVSISDLGTGNKVNAMRGGNTVTPPTYTLLTGGMNIGTLTGNGGLAAAFDGITSKVWNNCAREPLSGTTSYIGKSWGVGKIIRKYEIYGSSDFGLDSTQSANNIIITLQGSNDNFTSQVVDLHTDTFADANAIYKSYINGIISSNGYSSHRVKISMSGGNPAVCAQVKFYE